MLGEDWVIVENIFLKVQFEPFDTLVTTSLVDARLLTWRQGLPG